MRHAYGMAFVILAYAFARRAGVAQARDWLDETWDTLETHFWDAEFGIYRDEADSTWKFSGYRGRNSNMHLCEALLDSCEASSQERYLQRAFVLADHITNRQAALADGLVWEHYDVRWQVDWQHNRDNPKHLFRLWGFQPGHQTEWAKLLLMLERHVKADWLLPNAQRPFHTSMSRAWDEQHGGICYGFAPDGSLCDDDKYCWE